MTFWSPLMPCIKDWLWLQISPKNSTAYLTSLSKTGSHI